MFKRAFLGVGIKNRKSSTMAPLAALKDFPLPGAEEALHCPIGWLNLLGTGRLVNCDDRTLRRHWNDG